MYYPHVLVIIMDFLIQQKYAHTAHDCFQTIPWICLANPWWGGCLELSEGNITSNLPLPLHKGKGKGRLRFSVPSYNLEIGGVKADRAATLSSVH